VNDDYANWVYFDKNYLKKNLLLWNNCKD